MNARNLRDLFLVEHLTKSTLLFFANDISLKLQVIQFLSLNRLKYPHRTTPQ